MKSRRSVSARLTLSLFALFMNYTACFGQADKRLYSLKREKASSDTAILSGSVVEFATNQPLQVAYIGIDSTVIQADTLGHFRYELLPGTYTIWAGFIGYYKIYIEKVRIRKGDRINILFRVKEDDRPLID